MLRCLGLVIFELDAINSIFVCRCFKEIFLEQKTRNSSIRPQNRQEAAPEEEAAVARTTEVSLGRVKWNLTDEDGQLNLAQFEMKDFLYDKVRA